MKFAKQNRQALQINLTPLIDVVFLLLIFFMVTTTFNQDTQLQIDLPQITMQQQSDAEAIQVFVNKQGQIAVEEQLLLNTSALTLNDAIKAHNKFNPDGRLILSADAQAPHQMVVRVMDVAAQLGYHQVQIRGDLNQ
jgi:biopolymer transport protein ExbD